MVVLRGVGVLVFTFAFITVSVQTPTYADVPGVGPGCEIDISTGNCVSGSRQPPPPGPSCRERGDCPNRQLDRRQRQARELVDQGYDAFARGSLEEALEYYREALELDPNSSEAAEYVHYMEVLIAGSRHTAVLAHEEGQEALSNGYFAEAIRFFEEEIAFTRSEVAEQEARRNLQTARQRYEQQQRVLDSRDREFRVLSTQRCNRLDWCRTLRLVDAVGHYVTRDAWTDASRSGNARTWWDTPGDDPGATAIPRNPDEPPNSRAPIYSSPRHNAFPEIPEGHAHIERLRELRDYVLEQRRLANAAAERAAESPTISGEDRDSEESLARNGAADAATDYANCIVNLQFIPGASPSETQCE